MFAVVLFAGTVIAAWPCAILANEAENYRITAVLEFLIKTAIGHPCAFFIGLFHLVFFLQLYINTIEKVQEKS